MADLTLSTRSSIDTTSAQFAQQHAGKILGADVAAGQPLELRADGKIYPWAGASSTGAFFGISPRTAKAGQPITNFGLSTQFLAVDSGLVIGATYYLSNTAGKIADAASTLDTKGTFVAVNANDLIVIRPFGKVS